MLRRAPGPQTPLVLLLLAALWLSLACRPNPAGGLGDGPPELGDDTTILSVFDPAGLAGPAATGFELDDALAGPPQPPEPAPLPAPAVVDYGPTGEASEYPDIQVRFNRPIVPLAAKQRVSAEEAGFRIDPPIEGEAYWAEPTRLVFQPKTALPLATEFQVALDTTLAAVDGPELDVELDWSFATQAPKLSMWADYGSRVDDGSSDHYHWKTRVALTATHGLGLAELRDHLSVEARGPTGDLVPVDVRVSRVAADRYGYRYPDFWIAPRTRWPADSEIIVTVDAELHGELGPRPIGYPTVYSFRTPAGVEAVERVCEQGEYEDGCEIGPVLVRFSTPISRAQAKHLSISPAPRGLDALAVDREYGPGDRPRNAYRSVALWGDFQRGQAYTITIDDKLRDVHGQPLTGARSFELEFIEPPPSLALEQSRGSFSSTVGAKLGVESRHVETLRVRVALLDDTTHERLFGADVQGRGWPSGLDPTHEQTVTLTHTGQFGWSSHELDLRRFTGGAPAAALVEVSAESLLPRARQRSVPGPRRGLVQVTDLGLTAVGSLPGGAVRVAHLSDDSPVAGATVELIPSPGERLELGRTDAEGLLKLPSSTKLGEDALLRAREGQDQVLIDIGALTDTPAPSSSSLRSGESVRTTLMTERPLYRPGERVRALGWSAIATPHEFSGLRRLPSKTRVELELRDHRDEIVASKTVRAKDHGKFWATLAIPETAALGHYELRARLLDAEFRTTLEVKDFPVPEFEVTAEAKRSDLHVGESTQVFVNASYYFGGRVPITRARHTTDCVEADYRPPGLDPSYLVAPRRSYWSSGRGIRPAVVLPDSPGAQDGHVEYDIRPGIGFNGVTQRCTHSVAVADISEREVGAELGVWVHPPFYLAAHVDLFNQPKTMGQVSIEVVDFDGAPLSVDEVELTLTRTWSEPEYAEEDGERRFIGWAERRETTQPCKFDALEDLGLCTLNRLEYGSYEVRVRAKQGDYEPELEDWFYVERPRSSPAWSAAPVQRLRVELDRPEPKPGQTIHARISAPWSTGSGMLLLAKGGLHELRTFSLDQGRAELAFEVGDAWIPGAELHVLAVEPPGKRSPLPALHAAQTAAEVASDSRRLAVSVEAPAEAQPRERVPIEVHVRDHLGQPVSGHVAVWAVDEAVLSLAPLVLPEFVANFVVGFAGSLDIVSGYAALMLPFVTRGDPYEPLAFKLGWAADGLGLTGHGYGGGSGYGSGSGFGAKGSGPNMPSTRNKFESAPIFIADAELDEQGVARLAGELPDNLTTFRLTAVASSPIPSSPVEARFGTGDARIRVSRPLVVRAAMPRIMRPGDLAELGVIVDNLRGPAGTVELELELHDAEGILELLDRPKASASVEAGGQLRLPFRVRALTTGTPELEVRAHLRPKDSQAPQDPQDSPDPRRPGSSEPLADAVRLPLPVEPERTLTDRVAVYGSLAEERVALLPFAIPSDADPEFGGLSVSIGSTLLGGLEDAVAYLVDYPYGCLEQTSSSLLPLIPLGRLAEDYPLGIDDLDHYVAAGINRLRAMQLASGGFAYWPGGTNPAPYPSAYATWVLGRARAAGYAVPEAMLEAADQYLLSLVAAWQTQAGPSEGQDIEAALALMALAERGRAPAAALTNLYGRRQRLPVFSQATLLLALEAQAAHSGPQAPHPGPADPRVAELLGELKSLVDEREAVAKVELSRRWTWYWDSAARSSALVLIAILRADPKHPLAAKLTRGLLEARRGGRWSNTQENAYALVALAEYAAVYEAEEPRFAGRVWLGQEALATVHVEGREFGFEDGFTPMSELLTAARTPEGAAEDRLILERAGEGRMYYRVGLEWASTATDKPARAEGIALTRTLRGPQGPVGEDQAVESGSRLAIDVELEIPAALDHVAIEIPLPAGLEAVDLELGKGGAAMKLSGRRGAWVSHQELRRDRAILFADHLEPGRHRSTLFLRATTPGEYVMPAGHAEMMYYPEVYGRTTARRLLVR